MNWLKLLFKISYFKSRFPISKFIFKSWNYCSYNKRIIFFHLCYKILLSLR